MWSYFLMFFVISVMIWYETGPIQWICYKHRGYWWPGAFSTRASVATMLSTHPCISSYSGVNKIKFRKVEIGCIINGRYGKLRHLKFGRCASERNSGGFSAPSPLVAIARTPISTSWTARCVLWYAFLAYALHIIIAHHYGVRLSFVEKYEVKLQKHYWDVLSGCIVSFLCCPSWE